MSSEPHSPQSTIELITAKTEISNNRPISPGENIRYEINKVIERGSMPIFEYPLPSLDISTNLSNDTRWSVISNSILTKSKKMSKHG